MVNIINSIVNVLILTATITPPADAKSLLRIDPNLRLNDYSQALKFYLPYLADGTISNIVFVENFASDISSLGDLAQKYGVSQKIEFISFKGLDYPSQYGRGHGEFKMIDYAMKHSEVIQKLSIEDNIWKITGRYILLNFAAIIKTRPSHADFFCNCRNRPIYSVDLYVLCWNKKAYNEILKNVYQNFRDDLSGGYSEQVFRRIIDQKVFNSNIVKRFRTVPRLAGYRGMDNKPYEQMPVKLAIRQFANTVLPWLWI